ncbi:MAG TPA: hypothetical protein VFQ20_03055 [Burkholderiaceae bacterium]|nr:hypothetical protein [Burkholderiaceae bacterium]
MRLRGWLLALGCGAAGALAQTGAPSDPGASDRVNRQIEERDRVEGMMRRIPAGVALTDAEKAVQSVIDAVAAADCAGATARLNAGIAKAYPEVFALAGVMFEEGLCLKPNWERALGFYERALAAGQGGVAARIAAGYAAPIGGRDQAAALWWSIRARTALPAPCSSVANLVADADKFVAALNAWPAGQLRACAYAAAVMATIQADAESPLFAAGTGLRGSFKVTVLPEQGRVDIDDAAVLAAGGAPTSTDDRDATEAKKALSARLRRAADLALKRYDRPAGIAADWRAQAEFALKSGR